MNGAEHFSQAHWPLTFLFFLTAHLCAGSNLSWKNVFHYNIHIEKENNYKYRALGNFVKWTHTYSCVKTKNNINSNWDVPLWLTIHLPQKVSTILCILSRGVIVPKGLKIVFFFCRDILLYLYTKHKYSCTT